MTRSSSFAAPLSLIFGAFLSAGCSDGAVDPPIDPPESAQLAPPPAGEGFQISTGTFAIAPGEEVQDCHFYRVGDLAAAAGMPGDQPFNLSRVQIAQRDGSHHMNVFRVRTIVPDGFADFETNPVQHSKNGEGACFKSPLWADWPLIANSQIDGQLDWKFPDGVANELAPDEWIMLQTHYVNATSQGTPDGFGEVFVNFWNLPSDEVVHQMGTLFATKQSIRICRSDTAGRSFSGTCQVNSPSPVTIIGANAHFHSRGKQFDMYSWDGIASDPDPAKRFYSSTSWDEPPMAISPELTEILPDNGGVYYTCGFEWREPDPAVGCAGLDAYDKQKLMMDPDGDGPLEGKTEADAEEMLDCCYRFGPIVEKNEHCNIFAYYYPASDDVICY
jgi:hypothetical protein